MIPDWIQTLSDEDARRTAAEIAPVLQAATERVHYAEGRRGQYIAVAAGLFAGAIALASIANQALFGGLNWSIEVAAGGFFVLSVFLFYVYSKQVNRYPWTSATKTWKWFYRDAIPEQEKFDLSFYDWMFRWGKEVTRAKGEFNRQLPLFGASLQKLVDPRESLWQDVQQLYVLHINEKYKNAYLSRLRSILTAGLVAILSLVVFAAAIQFLMGSKDAVRTTVTGVSTSVVLSASRYEGPECENDCWLANVSVANASSEPVSIGIGTNGSGCLVLPTNKNNPFSVSHHSTTVHAMYLVCPDATPAMVSIAIDANGG